MTNFSVFKSGLACLATLFACVPLTVCYSAETTPFDPAIRKLIQTHCQHCHDDSEASGSVNFVAMTSQEDVLAKYATWKKVVEQIQSGNMPPADEKPLPAAVKEQLLGWVEKTFDTTGNPDPGPTLLRQLTREEYAQTMRDLFHFWFDPAGDAGIPEERVVDGFANRAGGQVLEASLMERYFTAADLALEKLFTEGNRQGTRREFGIEGDLTKFAVQWEQHLHADQTKEQPPVKSGEESAAIKKQAARQVLQTFLRKAFRRPVSDDEVEHYARFADAAMAAGDDYPQALRKAMKPILVSPHFLLRVEAAPPAAAEKVVRVNDHQLAVRLSYFLWGTMPDDELFALADQGKLAEPAILEQQVRRMLAHNKAETFTRQFLAQLLQLPHLHKALPSQNQFPTFTRSLRDAMERETFLFCDNLRKEDRSILELLDSDYTFVNSELAKHYQLPETPGQEFVKVSLRPEDHRGGVLGMASVLTMTSHTDRTKPTARGKWVLEVLLGAPPPPPPANAGNFAPADKDRPEPESFREKLAQHAADPNCVSCHRRVDPLGFALENYDAIGTWRESLGDRPIDNQGSLPGIGDFAGVDGLRKVLREKQPQFVRNMAEQTLRYALGRDVSYYDEPSITQIVSQLSAHDYRFSTLILEVVRSYPFQHRRNDPEQP